MKSFVVLCVALVAFEVSYAQVIRSIAPGIIGGLNNCGCPSSILAPIPSCPSSIIGPIPSCPSSIIGPIPSCPSSIIAPIPSCPSPIIAPVPSCSSCSSPVISAIPVVQQNSVAASLADTLSLLTVSSLLAETLPLGNVVVPPCSLGMGCGGYYY